MVLLILSQPESAKMAGMACGDCGTGEPPLAGPLAEPGRESRFGEPTGEVGAEPASLL